MAHIWKKNYGDNRLTLQSLLRKKTINLYEKDSNGASMSVIRSGKSILLRVSSASEYHVGSGQRGVQFIVNTNNVINKINKIIIPKETTIKMSVDCSLRDFGLYTTIQWCLLNFLSSYSGSGWKDITNAGGVWYTGTLVNYMRTGNWCYSFYFNGSDGNVSVNETMSFTGPIEIDTTNLDITNYFGICFIIYNQQGNGYITINSAELEIDGKVYLE